MVDRILEKKRWSTKRLMTIGGIAALILLIGASYYYTKGPSKLSVDTERITISEIKKGAFQENIPVNGVVMPLSTIYLDATEGGRVEERFVEDGAIVKKDQPILRLSNTDLLMTMMSQQNTVYNTLTQMQINHNAALQNTVSKQTQVQTGHYLCHFLMLTMMFHSTVQYCWPERFQPCRNIPLRIRRSHNLPKRICHQ